MAYTQRTARVYDDGCEEIYTSDFRSVEISRTPTCDVDRIYLARFELEETASTSPAFKLERQLNAGSWADVTASSTVAKALRSHSFDNTTEVTENRASGSALGFVVGQTIDDGSATAVALNNQHTEHVFGFYIPSGDVSDADTVRLRCYVSTSGDLTYTETIEITVEKDLALPGLISTGRGNTHVETISFVGPICDSNGNLYVFSEANADFASVSGHEGFNIHAWKSVNGGVSWLPIGDTPTTGDMDDMESLSIVRFAPHTTGEYWIGLQSSSSGHFNHIIWRSSDHATNPDTWDNTASGEVTGTASPVEYWIATVEKSDGDVWHFGGQTISTDERVYYARQVAGSWQSMAALSVATGVNFVGGKASLGASDRVVVCYQDQTNADIYMRAIADDLTFYPTSSESQVNLNSTTVCADGTGGGGNNGDTDGAIVDVLCYDDTNDYHLVIWLDDSDTLRSNTIKWNGSGYDIGATPPQVSTTTVDIDYPNGLDANSTLAGMAVDQATGTVYVFYVGQDFKLYYNSWTEAGGWGTETELLAAQPVTARIGYVSCQVFTHSSGNGGTKVLGYAYKAYDATSEGSEVDKDWRYDEIELSAIPGVTFDFGAGKISVVGGTPP